MSTFLDIKWGIDLTKTRAPNEIEWADPLLITQLYNIPNLSNPKYRVNMLWCYCTNQKEYTTNTHLEGALLPEHLPFHPTLIDDLLSSGWTPYQIVCELISILRNVTSE